MIDDSKSRQPGDAVFATFKIPYEKWQHFQHAAQLEGKTASATLVAFIEQYLSQEKTSLSSKVQTAELPSLEQLEMEIEQILEKRLRQAALPQVTGLEEKLDRLELVLRKFDERLGKVETAVSQWKSQQYQPPDLVDVEAVPVKGDRSSETRQPQPTPSEAEIGVAERTLCEQFGLNPDTLMRHARMRGLSAAEYLHQVTGWVYRDGKYYPGDR
ncbi:MAG TPA: hypothetical protein IGS17_10130 [Oscillatoriales cyanobacterium M59_W2019_021]|nr:hypothetical protein [Oscillatoriales cyanobacterium M4454_W2019_049]HIK51264.1 hypothetical protein [Oscillatoriales cyanobacterium M59_W2019_021]